MDAKTCGNCKHRLLPSAGNLPQQCVDCWEPELKGWEPADKQDFVYRGADMGSPEGSFSVVKAIIRETVDAVDENWKLTKYAVAGIRAELAALGLRLTDKNMPRGECWHCMDRLYTLTRDLSEYEERLEKIEKAAKAGQVPKP